MKLWGGRFEGELDREAAGFQASLPFDRRLVRQDIRGSVAHARMLGACGIVPAEDAEAMVRGLQEILEELAAGRIELPEDAEDVHTAVEMLLTQHIGEAGRKLHTARSRNDQVALDLRLYLKEEIARCGGLLADLLQALLDKAGEHVETVMPGYTHLQKAQPVTLAHHLMAYFQMFGRDLERLLDCHRRTDVLPLGSGALAGTTFPIDREMVARELGFSVISANSMDAVADRDFAVEFCSAAALAMAHLSRLAEEIILWASDEFHYVEVDDAFATGSSIMPQKKNPDMAELMRGKTGRVYGDLLALLTVLKGLPLTYNKDLQEDKEALFDAADTLAACLRVCIPMLQTLNFRKERLAESAAGGFANATEVADYLAARGMPFREAHQVVGGLVRRCAAAGRTLEQLSLEEYRSFSPLFAEDIFQAISLREAVRRRDIPGGPAPNREQEALAQAAGRVEKWRQALARLDRTSK